MEQRIPAARNRMCRHLTRRQMSWKELRVRVTIVNDPEKLAQLSAELQQRKLRLATTDSPDRKIRLECRSKIGEVTPR